MPTATQRRVSVGEGAAGEDQKLPRFTWQEVAERNTAKEAWVIYDTYVYDVTEWAKRHPGGSEVILLAAGRDCTDLFNAYHCFNLDRARKMLAAYKIGRVEGLLEFPAYKPDTGFHRELSKRVSDFFAENKIDSKDPTTGLMLLPLFLATFAAGYVVAHNALGWETGALPAWAPFAAAVLMGWAQAMPLLHMMHDSCHLAFGHSELLTQVVGRGVFDWFAGGSIMSWQHQHVIGHHTYTNVYQADPDLPLNDADMRRSVDRQAWRALYKWQWIYMPLLYPLLALKYRYDDIFEVLFRGINGSVRVNHFNNPIYRLVLPKLVWLGWRIAVPIYVFNQSAAMAWLLFVITELVTGAYLAYNFQVSHISDVADWPLGKEAGASTGEEWARSQVETAVNYGGGPLANFLAGHLNYQIEHHLFPGISQYHYPRIAPIVKEVCKEYGVRYNFYPNYWQAFKHHLAHLYNMGQRGIPAHLD